VLVGGLLWCGARGQDRRVSRRRAAQSAPRRIAYKEENSDGFGALALRLGGGLVLMAILALPRRCSQSATCREYWLFAGWKSRIQLLESRRITRS